jgi:multisubunit Na+/H+ antiporter MnhB subunit
MESGSNMDAQIEAFHRAERKRKAMIYGIAGVIGVAVGAITLAIALLAPYEPGDGTRVYSGKVIVLGIAMVLAGIGGLYNAYRIGSGQVADVDYDVRS